MGVESKTLYLCIHVLQVAPVSCINRDDTGTPKTCVYGGTSRMRVSSQCWKRAVRMYLRHKYDDTGERTKIIVKVLSNRIAENTGCETSEAQEYVQKWLSVAGIIAGKKDKKGKEEKEEKKDTSAFFSDQQIDALSELLSDRYPKEKAGEKGLEKENAFKSKLVDAVKNKPSVSELLFGRMFAQNPSLNYDAACQVAHAFSVNEVYEEPDYFTVVGDLKQEEALAGSDYLDTKLFNSGVLYRFADVNLSEGTELRNERYSVDAAKAASRFLEAFVIAMPTGSINAYANMTLPETVVVELREDTPVSFAPAFVQAIEADNIVAAATDKMIEYEDKIGRLYGNPVKKWVLGDVSLKELCDQLEEEINRRL